MLLEIVPETPAETDELTAGGPESTKMTAKQAFVRFFWLYKWPLIIGLTVLALAAAVMLQMSGRGADYLLYMVTEKPVDTDTIARIEAELALYGVDLNEDGQVTVTIRAFAADNPADMEKLAAALTTREGIWFALEDTYYQRRFLERGNLFFQPMKALKELAGVSDDSRYWCWAEETLYSERQDKVPRQMFFGVRAGTPAEDAEPYENLLNTYITRTADRSILDGLPGL